MIQVRSRIYRGRPGFAIIGMDTRGRRLSIWCHHEETARKIAAAVKADDHEQVDQLLRKETPR